MRKELLMIIVLIITVIIVAIIPSEPWRPQVPTVAVTSLYNMEIEPGQTFLVNITVTNVTDLYMWFVNMSWDPNIIQITTGDPNGMRKDGTYYNIYEGPFMKSIRDTRGYVSKINNTGGTIKTLTYAFQGPGSILSGSGVLAMINFTLLEKGTAIIDINGPSVEYPGHCVLQDHSGNEIVIEVVDGTVTESGPPPIWTQFWFLTTVIGIVVIIAEVAAFYVIIKKRPSSKKQKEEKLQGIP
jgi:hypothetical protein